MRHLLLFIAVLCLSCATTWVHPSKSLNEFHQDSAECSALAGQASVGLPVTSRGWSWQRTYDSCMLGKGWTKE